MSRPFNFHKDHNIAIATSYFASNSLLPPFLYLENLLLAVETRVGKKNLNSNFFLHINTNKLTMIYLILMSFYMVLIVFMWFKLVINRLVTFSMFCNGILQIFQRIQIKKWAKILKSNFMKSSKLKSCLAYHMIGWYQGICMLWLCLKKIIGHWHAEEILATLQIVMFHVDALLFEFRNLTCTIAIVSVNYLIL